MLKSNKAPILFIIFIIIIFIIISLKQVATMIIFILIN